MNYFVLNPDLRRRLSRVARIVERADRWAVLAFMSEEEAQRLLAENEANEAAAEDSEEQNKKIRDPKRRSYLRKADAPQDTSRAYAPEVPDDLDGELGEDDMLAEAEDEDSSAETLRTDEIGGVESLTQDDGAAPAGPRNEKNKSRYQVQPGHGQGLSDLLRSTAAVAAAQKIARLLTAEGKYSHIDFKPPESVANAAKRGLKLREKASPSNKGGLTTEQASKQGIGSGVQRAVNLSNRTDVSPETISKMVSFFARHSKNKSIAAEHRSTPWNDKGYVAWLLWGGDPGEAWANKIKKQMEKASKKKSDAK